jgi:hypothetical protein
MAKLDQSSTDGFIGKAVAIVCIALAALAVNAMIWIYFDK